MNKQDKFNLDPGLKQIVEDYWKEKWQYFSRQQDESDREYVRAFKEELIDLVAKATQYQKEQTEKEIDDFLNKGIVSAKGMAVSLAYEKGKSDMKQEMLKSAKQGTAQKDYQLILDDGTYIDLDPSMSLNPAVKVKEGQRVLVSIITEN
jgi:hypothetical protein